MENNRDVALDFLKVIACIGVCVLHTIDKQESVTNCILYYTGTISIPLFFMVNGSLILNKANIDYKYLCKKILKILRVSLTWCFIAYAIYRVFWPELLNAWYYDIGLCFLQKGCFGIYWFFGTLIIIYTTVPFIHKLYNNKLTVLLLIIVLVIACCIIHFISVIQSINGERMIQDYRSQTLRLWTHLCYFVMGGSIYKLKCTYKNKLSFYGILAIISLILTLMVYGFYVSNFVLSNNAAEFLYDSPITIIIVALVFLIANKINWSSSKNLSLILMRLSDTTLGVYLLHQIFVTQILNSIGFSKNFSIINPIIVFTISSAITYSFQKNKILKKFVSL